MPTPSKPRFAVRFVAPIAARRAMWSALSSVASHALVVALAVAASRIALDDGANGDQATASLLFPMVRNAPRPTQERIQFIGLNTATGMSNEVPSAHSARADDARVVEVPQASPLEPPPDPDLRAMSELEVDSTAQRDPGSEGPVYPPALLASGVEGATLVRFVVASDGTVDPESVRIMSATDSAFADAARVALPRMRFRPAIYGGKAVAQLVEQNFAFQIRRPAPSPPPGASGFASRIAR